MDLADVELSADVYRVTLAGDAALPLEAVFHNDVYTIYRVPAAEPLSGSERNAIG